MSNDNFIPLEDEQEINLNDIPENTNTDDNTKEETPEEQESVVEEVVAEAPPKLRTTKQGSEITDLYIEENPHASEETIDFPPLRLNELKEIISNMNRADITDSEENKRWFEILQSSLSKETFKQVYEKALDNTERNFKQFVEFNGKKLRGSRPRIKENDNQILKGNKAITSLMSYLGRGIHFQVPLWNSGIWLTFVSPGETEILELHRQLIYDKIQMGRYTYGLSLSGSVSYTVDRLVDFALQYVYASTLKLTEEDNVTLKDVIVAQDIPSLLWGLACAIYPNGFKYRRPCVHNPEKCTHVDEGDINISFLQMADDTLLTDFQKAHMSDRQTNCKDLASIKRYKEDHSSFINKTVAIKASNGKDINFTFKSPSISQYVESGYRWIASMTELVENSIVVPENDEKRNEYINENSKATSIRQYTHWVKEIEFKNSIQDKETIESTLNYLSADTKIADEFMKEAISYIENSSVAVIGIPNYTCPKCQTLQYESELKVPFFKEIIPLDPIVLFTDLIMERIEIINQR